MKTSRQKIIEFMQKKQEIIKEFNYEFRYMYFNKEDERIINVLWTDKDCDLIWHEIKDSVYNYEATSLFSGTCPFCHKYICDHCHYATNHNGRCSHDDGSDWSTITSGEEIHNVFTNDLYLKIIREVEYENN